MSRKNPKVLSVDSPATNSALRVWDKGIEWGVFLSFQLWNTFFICTAPVCLFSRLVPDPHVPYENKPHLPTRIYVMWNENISLSHTTLSLSVTLNAIYGKVGFDLAPLKSVIKTLRFHCRQCNIKSIKLNEQPLGFRWADPLLSPDTPGVLPLNPIHTLRSVYLQQYEIGKEGELIIDVPEALQPKVDAQSSTPEQECYLPWNLVIEYELNESNVPGFWSTNEDWSQGQLPYITIHSVSGQARWWIPCVEPSLNLKTTMDVYVSIPANLGIALEEAGFSTSHLSSKLLQIPFEAISGLESIETFYAPHSENRRVVYAFATPVAISFASLMFAIGPFRHVAVTDTITSANNQHTGHHEKKGENSIEVPNEVVETTGEGGASKLRILTLPGYEDLASESCWFLRQCMGFFESWVGVSYPFTSHTYVFVDKSYTNVLTAAGISLIHVNQLSESNVIDTLYDTRYELARTLAAQWFGQYMSPKEWEDMWLTIGISNYMTGLYMKKCFGNNEYRFRQKKDMETICELDVNQPPLSPPSAADHAEMEGWSPKYDPLSVYHFFPEENTQSPRAQLLNLKSALVMHILDVRLGAGVLQKVMNKLMISVLSGDLPQGLGTKFFLRLCGKVSGKLDLKDFGDQWIFGAGVPIMSVLYGFNRKKMMVELRIKQENTSSSSPHATPEFTGPFTVRVQEPGGTFDTEFRINNKIQQIDVIYHTKYKRIRRRGGKRSRKTDQDDDDENDNEDTVGNPEDSLMEMDPTESGAKFDEPDRVVVEWVRLDPETRWLGRIVFKQEDFMWYARLRKERDIVSQFESIIALAEVKTAASVNALLTMYTDSSNFYRLRMEAIRSLAHLSSEDDETAPAMEMVLKAYRDEFGRIEQSSGIFVPNRNDFSSLQKYYLQHALLASFTDFSDASGRPPIQARRLLCHILQYNENSGNKYDDCFLLARVIASIGDAFLAHADPARRSRSRKAPIDSTIGLNLKTHDIEEIDVTMFGTNTSQTTDMHDAHFTKEDRELFSSALKMIQHLLAKDKLAPSFRNVVTVSCLETLFKWQLSGLIPLDIAIFAQYLTYNHFLDVRRTAYDAIVLLVGFQRDELLELLVEIATNDSDPYMSYSAMQSLASYASMCRGVLLSSQTGALVSDLQKSTVTERLSTVVRMISDRMSFVKGNGSTPRLWYSFLIIVDAMQAFSGTKQKLTIKLRPSMN